MIHTYDLSYRPTERIYILIPDPLDPLPVDRGMSFSISGHDQGLILRL